MKVKATLRNDRQFGKVYINNDQSLEDRRLAGNLRTIVDAVNRGDTNLSVQGTRVVRKREDTNNRLSNVHERRHNSDNEGNRPIRPNGNNMHSNNYINRPDSNRPNSANTGRDNSGNRNGWTTVRRGGNGGRGRGGQRGTGFRGRN